MMNKTYRRIKRYIRLNTTQTFYKRTSFSKCIENATMSDAEYEKLLKFDAELEDKGNHYIWVPTTTGATVSIAG